MPLNSYKNNAQYPDRYSRSKSWAKILPVQGRPIQAAELIEIQSLIQDNLKQGFNTLFKNGTAIQGLKLSVASRQNDSVTITVSPGQLYLEGMILDTTFSTLVIPLLGTYDVYVKVNESIVTELEDSSLRDPIKGAYALGMPGASRLIWNTSVSFVDESVEVDSAYAIGQVVNGIILQKEVSPFFEVQKILSKFIYERSGNFCVEGLSTSYIGLSRRSTANVNKYSQLQNSLLVAKDNQQLILARAIAAQQLVGELTNQELAAINNSLSSPTQINQANLVNISSSLSQAKTDYAKYSSDLVDAQRLLRSSEKSLSNAENLVTDQQIVSISPGIAYVLGNRVSLNSPSQLFIPVSLPTTNIESASYTYRGISALSLRTFNISTGKNTILHNINADAPPIFEKQYTSFVIEINNIERNLNFTNQITTNSFNLIYTYKIKELLTLEQILNNVVLSFNSLNLNEAENIFESDIAVKLYDNQQVTNPEITVQDGIANTPPMSKSVAKTILKNYIIVQKAGSSTISFNAEPAVLNGKNISINFRSKIYLLQNDSLISPFSDLNIDIPSAPLNQPISTSTYRLGFRPVNKIERLIAELKATNVAIVRGQQIGGVDVLPDNTVIDIISVTQVSINSVITFNNLRDYRLSNNGIEWLGSPGAPLGQQGAPRGGTTYFVTFTYSEPLSENTDFILNDYEDTIEFIGRTPDINSRFTVDYSYFLSKAGVISLSKDGVLDYVLSSAAKNPVPPPLPDNLLALASFTISTNDLSINKLECRRQTVEDLYDLSEKVRRNSQNNAALKLDIETLNNALLNNQNPLGIFCEAGIDFSKIDTQNTTAHIIPGVQSFMVGSSYSELPVNYRDTGSNARIVKNDLNIDTYAIIPYTETYFFRQPRATKTIAIETLDKSINKRARLYSDKQVLFLNQGSSNISPCDPITRAGNAFLEQSNISNTIAEIRDNVRNVLAPTAQAIVESIESGLPVTIANTTNNAEFIVKAFNDIKAKEVVITLKAEGLPSGVGGFLLYLDKSPYSKYRLINNTQSSISLGSKDGIDGFSIKSDGTSELAVTLPNNLPTGTHTFSIEKPNVGYCKTNIYIYNNLLTHITLGPIKAWNALPLKTSSSRLIPIQKEDLKSENISSLGIDPNLAAGILDSSLSLANTIDKAFPPKAFTLNQIFTPADNYFLTSIELKIASTPTGNNDNLYLFLTNAEADLPRSQIYGVAKVKFGYNNTVLNLNVSGINTNFEFNTPQLIERGAKYNVGLESYVPNNSPRGKYEIYSAVIDEPDLVTGSIVGQQLYLDGDLLSSVDGSSYSFESKEDLTIGLKRAEFVSNSKTIVNLGNYITINPVNYFCLNTRDVLPIGTEINYLYRRSGSNDNFISFRPNLINCLSSSASGIEIHAELKSNFTTVSPMLLLNGSSVSLYSTKDKGILQSNLVTYEDVYTKVNIGIEYIKPAGTNIEIFYSPTRGFGWEGIEWFKLNELANTTKILNPDLQLYQTTYERAAGADTADKDDKEGLFYVFRNERKYFRYRIVISANNDAISPLVRKVQTYVSRPL